MFNIRADIEDCYANGCRPLAKAWEKAVLLSSIDSCWQEQLREMDELRKSVQNAAYEQKDPLVISQDRGVRTLEEDALGAQHQGRVDTDARPSGSDGLCRSQGCRGGASSPRMQEEEARRRNAVYMRQPAGGISQQAGRVNAPNPYAGYSTTHETYEGENAQREAARNVNRPAAPKQPVKADPKIGRNDPRPCGSGKKYKKLLWPGSMTP